MIAIRHPYESTKNYQNLCRIIRRRCEVFTSLFEIRKLRNNGFFEEGQIANELYFVTTGCIRLFYKVDVMRKQLSSFHEQFICAGEAMSRYCC